MERRIFLTALAGGLAVTTTAAFTQVQAAPATDLAGVRSALQPAAAAMPEEMQRRRWRRPPPWVRRRRRWMRRRRRCFINRRGFRVCRWY
ncbi:hypothetical protein [Phreatobacter cathodiphilus]|uniref:Uncharacterized protein n=1 Tax=Phreatobacter cathodiphilus TaxID=1868589 RepID=A0A2S0NBP9_9HYPH|nr:hypothetical protein [Phreatobacter cathodiphilus]AVO45582.1 hypothetical protein C6569_11185 [Phreatobacter cathodiphilus]